MITQLQPDAPFRVRWVCFSCGKKCKSRKTLYGHLSGCYWYTQFKDHIEDAPFYKKIPSKQLRYYYRNRPELSKRRKKQREYLKSLGSPGSASSGKLGKPVKAPSSEKKRPTSLK